MEIGLYTVLTDETMLPGEAAKLIEDAGFDAMAVGEHSHIPSSRESPYPGGDLPAAYARTLDLFVVFTAAALRRPACGLSRRSSRSPSATRSRPPRRRPASTTCPAVAST